MRCTLRDKHPPEAEAGALCREYDVWQTRGAVS